MVGAASATCERAQSRVRSDEAFAQALTDDEHDRQGIREGRLAIRLSLASPVPREEGARAMTAVSACTTSQDGSQCAMVRTQGELTRPVRFPASFWAFPRRPLELRAQNEWHGTRSRAWDTRRKSVARFLRTDESMAAMAHVARTSHHAHDHSAFRLVVATPERESGGRRPDAAPAPFDHDGRRRPRLRGRRCAPARRRQRHCPRHGLSVC